MPFAASLLLTGCKSPYVDASVRNVSSDSISLVEVQYPYATFGFQTVPPGSERHYRFKILGSGDTKLTYVDHAGKEHHSSGPSLHEGQSGSLRIVVANADVTWEPHLTSK